MQQNPQTCPEWEAREPGSVTSYVRQTSQVWRRLGQFTVQRSSGCWKMPLAPKDALKYGAGVRENTEGKSALEQ